MHVLGVRRRAVLVGRGPDVEHLLRTLGDTRGGIDYAFVGAISPTQDGIPIPRLGSLDDLGGVLEGRRVDELIVNGGDVSDEQLVELVEQAHQRGVQVRVAPTTAEILTQRAEYVPGQAVPLFELRPPVFAGVDRAMKRLFDLTVSSVVFIVGLPIWLLIALAIKLDSRGPVLVSRPQDRSRRARVRDDQVPDDARRCRAPAGLARDAERGVGAALQDPRRPPRDPRRVRCCVRSPSTRSRKH